ncbi:VanZ family protein [Evansella sp. AB-P1]|uniref:VanZ family protein n=1 Tax=Evansella sp. AB-P1 TaxID=3037653 RepID=UPI00241CD6B0|nr:VanZ family protein [Evansella sp. AB-P1]MDG5789587.1 VanZ family protein [Evansella sp. AB-P1]
MNVKGKKVKHKSPFPVSSMLFFIYMIVLIYITFFAWNHGASLGPLGPGGRNYNLDPFLTIYRISIFRDWYMIFTILIGNILLFIPFGLLFPLFLERFNFIRKPVKIIPVTVAAMCLSIIIEVNQFVFTYRVANIDDVILNTTGAFIGVLTYRVSRKIRII